MKRVRRSVHLERDEFGTLQLRHRRRTLMTTYAQDQLLGRCRTVSLDVEVLFDHPKEPRGAGWRRVTAPGRFYGLQISNTSFCKSAFRRVIGSCRTSKGTWIRWTRQVK